MRVLPPTFQTLVKPNHAASNQLVPATTDTVQFGGIRTEHTPLVETMNNGDKYLTVSFELFYDEDEDGHEGDEFTLGPDDFEEIVDETGRVTIGVPVDQALGLSSAAMIYEGNAFEVASFSEFEEVMSLYEHFYQEDVPEDYWQDPVNQFEPQSLIKPWLQGVVALGFKFGDYRWMEPSFMHRNN